MAMTKTEQAQMEGLKLARDLARSLRWPSYPVPAPMSRAEVDEARTVEYQRPSRGTELVAHGWDFNSHSVKVFDIWSTGMTQTTYFGSDSWSQGMGRLYASRLDALMAMRHELTERVAQTLAQVDAAIESAS